MSPFKKRTIFSVLLVSLLGSSFLAVEDWGFFAHRRINRLAVFTLPIELIPFYKKNIAYITFNATAPDKRRYAVATEGIRHYMDLDNWGVLPFEELPRTIVEARRKYTEVLITNGVNDSLRLFGQQMYVLDDSNLILKGTNFYTFFRKDSIAIDQEDYESFFYKNIHNPFYEETWEVDCAAIVDYFDRYDFDLTCVQAMAIDTFVEHGVLPYNLVRLQRSLTKAMQAKDLERILRISADMGHYIGDAHVPLHTTSNYNGRQTDQVGIHAFWETRLPELFADDTYNYFVGQAAYIENPTAHYWAIVLESHALVQDVLQIEKELSQLFPQDQQDCFVERGAAGLQNIPCRAYAKKYHEALAGQVEQRFRAAIKAVGSAWYTAWIDAGQPDLTRLGTQKETAGDSEEQKKLEAAFKKGKIFGRAHGGN